MSTVSQVRPVPRRGLTRIEASMYYGVSPSKFDEMVKDGRAPRPRLIDTRKVWDILELDAMFNDLPHLEAPSIVNSWNDA